jgi:nucleoside-triphosphatase
LSLEYSHKRIYLLTGSPGSGKTTLVKKAVTLASGAAGGFYTEEIREGGERKGFMVFTLAGQSAIMAHVDIPGRPNRVGKYGVDVEALDRVGVAALEEATASRDLIVIDEVGKMEILSTRFRQAVLAALDSGKAVLGTIMSTPHPWADAVKSRPDVHVQHVTRASGDLIMTDIARWLERCFG